MNAPSSVAAERVPAAAPLASTIATEGRGGAAGDDEAWPGPAARNEWTTDRPMRPGRTTGLVTHTAACTPARSVSHTDRIHPAEPGNASFLAIAAAAPFRFAHSAADRDQTERGVPELGAPSAVGSGWSN